MNLKVIPLTLQEFMDKFSAPREHYIVYLWQNRKIHHYCTINNPRNSFKVFYKSQMEA